MRALALTVLVLALPAPAAAADLVCRPEILCGDGACRATDPTDDEAAIHVRDAIGAAPELYLGEGRWVRARRGADGGAVVWTAAAGPDEPVVLGLARTGGAFLMTRREPGASGRVWSWAGRCATR